MFCFFVVVRTSPVIFTVASGEKIRLFFWNSNLNRCFSTTNVKVSRRAAKLPLIRRRSKLGLSTLSPLSVTRVKLRTVMESGKPAAIPKARSTNSIQCARCHCLYCDSQGKKHQQHSVRTVWLLGITQRRVCTRIVLPGLRVHFSSGPL